MLKWMSGPELQHRTTHLRLNLEVTHLRVHISDASIGTVLGLQWPGLIVLLALIATAGCGHTRPTFQPPPEKPLPLFPLVCGLSVSPSEIPVGGRVRVVMTIYNRKDEILRFLPSDTPLDHAPETGVYEVTRDGNRVDRRGYMGMRDVPRPAATDYLTIPPWGSISGTVDITDAHDFNNPGDYLIGWDRWLRDVQRQGALLPPKELRMLRMACTPALLRILPAGQPDGKVAAPPRDVW